MINLIKPVDIAYNFLIINNIKCFPFNPLPIIRRNGITLDSLQQYSIITDVPFATLTVRGKVQDGYVIKAAPNGKTVTLILYDQDSIFEDKLWTIWHEVGHVLLRHKKDGFEEEAEANLFVTEIFMPRPILTAIEERGYILTPNLLDEYFHVPEKPAYKRIASLHKGKEATHRLDETLRTHFSDFLNWNFPDFWHDGEEQRYSRLFA